MKAWRWLWACALLVACGGDDVGAGGQPGAADAADADTTDAGAAVDAADATDAGDASSLTDADVTDVADASRDAGPDGPLDVAPDGDTVDAGRDAVVDTASDAELDTGDTGGTSDTGERDADAGPDTPTGCADGDGAVRFGDELVADGAWRNVALFACARNAHVMVAPRGASWTVYAEALPADARLVVRSPHWYATLEGGVAPEPLAVSDPAGGDGFTSVVLTPRYSGEHILTIERDRRIEEVSARVQVRCDEGCGRRASRYPIVLVHGYAGVDSYFGVLDYFYDIYDRMTDAGYAVYRPTTSPIATSVRRAEELAPQIDAILAETGARRVNLIGHSQGGLDARVLVSGMDYADRVASITTVSTPHRGIPLLLVDFASVMDFSPENMETFNLAYPDRPEVAYYSWSARTCGLLDFGCQRESDGESVDAIFVATHALLARFGENDGLVPTDSMPWGEHLGLLFADHVDSVGQIADREREDDPFDHRAFYLGEAARLADAGF